MTNLHLGFCWSFPGTTPEEGAARLRAYGFEGVELWPTELRQFGAERWAEALSAHGLRCFQVCPYFDFVHGETKVRESRAQLAEFLEYARILQCSRIRVFTGPPVGPDTVGAHQANEAQWECAITNLREFCDEAVQRGVELCLECHEGNLMEDSPSALRLLRAVDKPNLTANLQLPLGHENWPESVRNLGWYTTHLHIHNWTRGLGEGDLTFQDEGAFDWKPVLHTLTREMGRDLTLGVEHATHGRRHDPWETARRDSAFLRRLRDELARE